MVVSLKVNSWVQNKNSKKMIRILCYHRAQPIIRFFNTTIFIHSNVIAFLRMNKCDPQMITFLLHFLHLQLKNMTLGQVKEFVFKNYAQMCVCYDLKNDYKNLICIMQQSLFSFAQNALCSFLNICYVTQIYFTVNI